MHTIPQPVPLAPHPGRFADASLVGPDHPLRSEVEAFIATTYRQRFGAEVRTFMPHLLAYRDTCGSLIAAVGLRHAASGPLFVEHYLDDPVEDVLALRLPVAPRRTQIAEVGHFAASTVSIDRCPRSRRVGAVRRTDAYRPQRHPYRFRGNPYFLSAMSSLSGFVIRCRADDGVGVGRLRHR